MCLVEQATRERVREPQLSRVDSPPVGSDSHARRGKSRDEALSESGGPRRLRRGCVQTGTRQPVLIARHKLPPTPSPPQRGMGD